MKFSATLISFALCLAATVEGHAHIGKLHRRSGASATYTPPPQTTSTPAAPTSTPASPSGPNSKRGISYNDIGATKNFGSKITWQYNWASTPGGEVKSGIEFVPMLWGADPGHTGNWLNDAAEAIAGGASHILAFNEPDLGAQSNLSPQAAAAAYKQFIQPLAGKAKLCSPAITNGGAPMGTAWLDNFLNECTGCQIDCIAIHIYDSATNVQYYKDYITEIGTKYGKPAWVTEFGASGTTQQQQDFLNEMLPFLDNLDTVERYAYFMAGQDILVDTSDALTTLGQSYNSI